MEEVSRPYGRQTGRVLTMLIACALLASAVSVAAAGAAEATPVAGASPVAGPDCVAIESAMVAGLREGDACVVFVTGSPDAPPLDVYVDGAKVVASQPLRTSVAYQWNDIKSVAAGKRRMQVVETGKDPSAALIDKSLTFKPGGAYEVVLYDKPTKIRVTSYAVDLAPLPAKAARVRVINAGRDLGPVDSYAVAPGQPMDSAKRIAHNLKFGKAAKYVALTSDNNLSATNLYTVPTGTGLDSAVGTQLPAFTGEAWSYIALGANGGIVNYAYVGWHTQTTS
ncbi:MAG TPA: DUF4397 domain-containing protein [Thermomicrobiales bacterium]|jgi:hypothetical protein